MGAFPSRARCCLACGNGHALLFYLEWELAGITNSAKSSFVSLCTDQHKIAPSPMKLKAKLGMGRGLADHLFLLPPM